jgi:hypothetical protein
MRAFVRTVADDQFGVDSKLPRTLGALFFKPGLLTREFMDGRIARYIPPFRLYLLSSVLFFVLLSFVSVRQDWGGEAGREISREVARADTTGAASPDSASADSVSADSVATDSVWSAMRIGVSFKREQWMNDVDVNLPWEWLNQKIEQNLLALAKLPPEVATRRLTQAVIEELPKVMFVLLPFFALLLKLFYVLRKHSYVEHFVFALHLHAFTFLLFVGGLLYRSPLTIGILAAVIALYTFVGMKRVYRQGYVMTLLKWAAVGMIYFMFVVTGMVFALIWAFAAVSPV